MGRATVIRCGTLVDVLAGEERADQVVVIDGDRITAVGPAGATAPPPGATVIDLSGHTVLPGLIDCHCHLVGIAGCGDYAQELKQSEAQMTLLGVANAKTMLRSGFTSVRDVGTFRAFIDIALRDAINADVVEGPRMACAGAYVTVSQGGGTLSGLAPDIELPPTFGRGVANSESQVRQRVREILFRGADLIKVIATGAVMANGTEPGAPEFSAAELAAAVEEAALYGKHVAAHAHGAEGIKRAVRAGVRSIEHACYLDDEGIALMVAHGTYLVADIWWADWITEQGAAGGWDAEQLRKNDETGQAQRDAFAAAAKAGVRMAFGTDVGGFPYDLPAHQFATMVAHGLTPMAAVQAATVNAAELIGWGEVGAIAPGRYADLVAIDGNGLDMARLTDMAFVMKGGKVMVRR